MNRSYSKIRHMQESNIILENRLLNEQVSPTFKVGDNLKVSWVNDVYQTFIHLKVKSVNGGKLLCVVTKLDGPFEDVKEGEVITLSINNGNYSINKIENSQKIQGPLKQIQKV